MVLAKVIDCQMDAKLTSEEYAQILQTIEMFEVISQAEPGDCQSYDILKEAYLKIGQTEAALQVSRKLAEAYLHMGLYSSALLECEGILQHQPDSPDIVALMGEIESRTHNRNSVPNTMGRVNGFGGGDRLNGSSPMPDEMGSLTVLYPDRKTIPAPDAEKILADDDGNENFARFLIQHQILSSDEAEAVLTRVRTANSRLKKGPGAGIALSLLEEAAKVTGSEVDTLLSSLIDATKFGFIPLEYYDVDRSVVRLLPETLTLHRLMAPFDIVSRTMMIALSNPFDGAAKEAVQSQLDYHIQWYLARPSAISRVLRDVYRLENRE